MSPSSRRMGSDIDNRSVNSKSSTKKVDTKSQVYEEKVIQANLRQLDTFGKTMKLNKKSTKRGLNRSMSTVKKSEHTGFGQETINTLINNQDDSDNYSDGSGPGAEFNVSAFQAEFSSLTPDQKN